MNPVTSVRPRRARGVALPVMLIMLTVMLVSSIYLFKSSMSSTLTTSNLAYEAALVKAADLGLLTGFQWLNNTAGSNKALLEAHNPDNAYVATYDTTQGVTSPGFWSGSKTFDDDYHNRIEYVIHRMCSIEGSYVKPTNNCMQTAPNTSTLNNSIALGDSLASDSVNLAGAPQVHYIITARIVGARGGNVVNQAIVMIGA